MKNIISRARLLFQNNIINVDEQKRWLWDVSDHASQKISEWGLPERCSATLLLLPIYEDNRIGMDELQQGFGEEISGLIKRLANRESPGNEFLDLFPNFGNADSHVGLLRQYIRQIYLDYPDLCWILCLLALHDGILANSTSEPYAHYIRNVYVPLLEMMGLWDIRYQWLEKTQYILVLSQEEKKRQYDLLVERIRGASWQNEEEEQKLLQWIELENYPNRIDTQEKEYRKHRLQIKKLKALWDFQDNLHKYASKERISSLPDIRVRPLRVSAFCDKAFQGAPIDELLNELKVDLLCESESDCYRLLGIVHGLGRPLAPRFTKGFNDYIADARENGFRALNTGIIYRIPKSSGGQEEQSDILIRVRIVTKQMDKVNREGVIQALYKNPDVYLKDVNYSHTWWHPTEHQRLLKKINRNLDSNFNSMSEFIACHPIDTRTEYLYVFTPRGQIKIMKRDSTPLDLAYEIHTELGNHAASIQVNGESTDMGYKLKNGDIVFINYDPNFAGPDLSWLACVTSTKARRNIRARLSPRNEDMHPGKMAILNALERTIFYYIQHKKFPIGISTYRVETFLKRMAQARKIYDLEQFYDLIQPIGKISPYYVVQKLITEELVDSIVREDGQTLDIPSFRINLCSVCKPVPREPIIGLLSTNGVIERLIIHRKDCTHLSIPDLKKKRIPLNWRGVVLQDKSKKHLAIQLLTENHPSVLWNVLECIDKCSVEQIYSFRTENKPDGSSEIEMKVMLPTFESSRELKRRLESIPYVHQVWAVPISAYQVNPRILDTHVIDGKMNPYFERPVFTREDFYDREEPIRDILAWIKGPLHDTFRVLHGARRIGKTSLAYHLEKVFLHPGNDYAVPVYIDVTTIEISEERGLLRALLKKASEKLKVPSFQFNGDADLLDEFDKNIQMFKSYQEEGLPILFVLDEFDRIVNQKDQNFAEKICTLFLNLMTRVNGVKWLVILSDTILYDSENRAAMHLLQKSNFISLKAFEWNYAQRLILEPAQENEIKFQDSFDTRLKHALKDYTLPLEREKINPLAWYIFCLGGGNPYYIKNICYYAWEHCVHSQRDVISFDDVRQGIDKLIYYGKPLFDHFLRVGGVRLRVLKCISDLSINSQWVGITQLKNHYQDLFPTTSPTGAFVNIEEVLDLLVKQGLAEYQDKNRKKFRLSVPLFGEFARNHMMADLTIQIPSGM